MDDTAKQNVSGIQLLGAKTKTNEFGKFMDGFKEYISEINANSLFWKPPAITVMKGEKHDETATIKINKLLEEYDFTTKLNALERLIGLTGIGAIGLTFNEKEPSFNMFSNTAVFLPIWDHNDKLISLLISQKKYSGTYEYYAIVEFTSTHIYRRFSNDENGKMFTFQGFIKNNPNYKINNKNFQNDYKHNLGFVPVVIIGNKPFSPSLIKPYTGGNSFSYLSNTANARHLEADLEETFNTIRNEKRRSRTMVIAAAEGQDLESNTKLTDRLNDFDNKDFVNFLEGQSIQYEGGVYSGLINLINTFQWQLKTYFDRCLIAPNHNIVGKNQKNDLEMFQHNRVETQYFEMKINYRQRTFTKALELYLKACQKLYPETQKELIDEKFTVSFEIMPNEIRDSQQVALTTIALKEAGLITTVKAIQQVNNISYRDALIDEKVVKKEQAAQAKLAQSTTSSYNKPGTDIVKSGPQPK